MDLLVLRHGQTPWTITGQHTGVTELNLTDAGRLEAVGAGNVIRRIHAGEITAVYVSPRVRARDTAAIALPGEALIEDPLLAEFGYGEFEGLTPAQIQARQPGWSIWTDGCPGGETLAEVAGRARRFLDERIAGDGVAIAVTHGHMSRILTATALGLAPDQASVFASATASISLVRQRADRFVLDLWNVTPRVADSTEPAS